MVLDIQPCSAATHDHSGVSWVRVNVCVCAYARAYVCGRDELCAYDHAYDHVYVCDHDRVCDRDRGDVCG